MLSMENCKYSMLYMCKGVVFIIERSCSLLNRIEVLKLRLESISIFKIRGSITYILEGDDLVCPNIGLKL